MRLNPYLAFLFLMASAAWAQPPAAPPPQPPAAQPVPPPATPQAPATAPQAPAGPVQMGGLNLQNVSLTEVIDQLAKQLHLNYIIDPTIAKAGVTMNTYGDPRTLDARNLLEQILRINGLGMVEAGGLYRIVPLKEISHQPLPLQRELNGQAIPDDDQLMLNVIFLKYVSVEELSKVLSEFIGENAQLITYAPANLLFILDSRRNMRRTMDLISQFDSDAFVNQRVHIFEVNNARPSDLVKDLDSILKSISLDSKTGTVRFLPVDRINELIAVAPNPGVFDHHRPMVDEARRPCEDHGGSHRKLRLSRQVRPGAVPGDGARRAVRQLGEPRVRRWVRGLSIRRLGRRLWRRLRRRLWRGLPIIALRRRVWRRLPVVALWRRIRRRFRRWKQSRRLRKRDRFSSQFGGQGACAGGGYGGQQQGYGAPAFGGYSAQYPAGNPLGATGQTLGAAQPNALGGVGAQLGTAGTPGAPVVRPPRIVPNPLDNALLIQADAQQYQGILKMLKELDIPPRQILLEAKIYEVDLTDQFAAGVTYNLQQASGPVAKPTAILDATGLGTLQRRHIGRQRPRAARAT